MEQIVVRHPIRSVCVYCGSGKGLDRRFANMARSLGRLLAQSGLRLVYGGGGAGLMGEIARSALANGGQVTGVIPESLVNLEHPIEELSELIVVRNLHERKMLMYERSDAFIALPGGLGHSRGTDRAAHLGAAWPSSKAHHHHQHGRILEPAAGSVQKDEARDVHPPRSGPGVLGDEKRGSRCGRSCAPAGSPTRPKEVRRPASATSPDPRRSAIVLQLIRPIFNRRGRTNEGRRQQAVAGGLPDKTT